MVMYREEAVGIGLPDTGIRFTKKDILQILEQVPDDAIMCFVGMFESFDIEFRWRRQLSPEEEQVERDRRAAELAAQEALEAHDRKLGF